MALEVSVVDTASKIKGLRFARVVVWLVYAYFMSARVSLELARQGRLWTRT